MNAWANPADSIIGKAEFFESGNENDRNDFLISRSDNGAEILFGKDAQGQSTRGQLNVDGSGDVEYTIRYPDGLPEDIEVEIYDLPKGATAYYRFEGLPDDGVIQDATAVGSLSALRRANETAWTRDGNGDFVIKMYPDRFLEWITPRTATPSDDAPGRVAAREVYADGFKIVIDARGSAQPSGNKSPIEAPADNTFAPDLSALPDRADSTSDTVQITSADSRWSDVASWDGGVPNADDIVIIGAGQRMVLDTDVTVKAILVNGGELVVEDIKDLSLAADWILVVNQGLFQVGSEDDPFVHEFDLTLEGDDVDVMALLASDGDNIVRASTDQTPVTPEPAPAPDVPATPSDPLVFAANIGGVQDVLASDGTVFQADPLNVGNRYGNMSVDIAGTEMDALYQTHAWSRDGLQYKIALNDGTYEVELHFAEIYGPTSVVGNRMFDARIEGASVVEGLDVFAEAGEDQPFVLRQIVKVTDGELTIDLINQVEHAMLSGLKVTQVFQQVGTTDTDFGEGEILLPMMDDQSCGTDGFVFI